MTATIADRVVVVTVEIAQAAVPVAVPAVADLAAVAPAPVEVPLEVVVADPEGAPARAGPAIDDLAKAKEDRREASDLSRRPRLCTATPCWLRCGPSRFP
jgi:hypothetical protein